MRGSQPATNGGLSVTFSMYARRAPMSSKSRIEASRKALAPAALLTVVSVLSGCSDIYYDRRETVALGADDHIAANRVAQMVDPWPRYVGNKNIAFNGERMQAAQERYRHGKV